MPETLTQCPLCGSGRSRLFDQRTFRGGSVSNRLCLRCGLVYQSPRMSAAEADVFYTAEYRRLYQGNEDPIRKDLAVQRARAASLADLLQQHAAQIGRHLDIGCSAGLLLQEVQRRYASQPTGVEPGDAYREYGRAQGLSVHASLEALKAQGQAGFDLVSLSHVVEHLPDPVTYLAHLGADLLAPGGWLLVEVPNLYAHDSFETAHLFSFSATTLGALLQAAGYEIVRMQPHGRPRSDLIPFFLTALARRTPASREQTVKLRTERMVACKRRLGLLRRSLLLRLFPQRAWKDL